MTVLENLEVGAYLRKDRDAIRKDLEFVYPLCSRRGESSWPVI